MLSKRKSQSEAFNLENPDGFQGEISSKTATPGQIISLDPVGHISPKSIGGYSLMWSVYCMMLVVHTSGCISRRLGG